MRETLARLESSSGRVELAAAGVRKDPELTTLAVLLIRGVDSSAWMELIRTCGVWTATEYWTAVFGSIQKFGAVWKLPDSETSRSLPTSRIERPTSCAAVRSTSTSSSGVSLTCARCTSTAPGMATILFARSWPAAKFAS